MSLLIANKRKRADSAIIANKEDKEEFLSIINDIITNDTVKQMKNYIQHCDTSCFEHCMHVAYYSYYLCKIFNLDYRSTARGAMLHDFFLYDWREKHRDPEFYGLHAFMHPRIALRNALLIFNLNEKEQDIIEKHMWPVTFFRFPKYKESYIVTLMDKYSALRETYFYIQSKLYKKNLMKYAYVFLSLILFRIV